MDPDFPAELGDLPFQLALYRAPGVGSVTFAALLESFGAARPVLDASPALLQRSGLKDAAVDYLRNPDWTGVDNDLAWLEQPDNHIIRPDDSDYPALLREIPAAPPLLFVHGDPGALWSFQLAMVGSRNPTPTGTRTARDFAAHLGGSGLTITSGLALGIDAASHEGALEGGGRTVAVTATGLDRVYPARHRELAHRIAASGGALVSEFPPGTRALPEHFPRRNRIISGLSLGTLVVEAALRSGSLITARHALEQGREVFAIPGSIHNPLARGCHELIRNGAKLVETADDIVAELAPLARAGLGSTEETPETPSTYEEERVDPEHQGVLEQVGWEPTPVDVLVERTGLTAEELSSMLLILELRGHVASCPGGGYIRVPKRGNDERECP